MYYLGYNSFRDRARPEPGGHWVTLYAHHIRCNPGLLSAMQSPRRTIASLWFVAVETAVGNMVCRASE